MKKEEEEKNKIYSLGAIRFNNEKFLWGEGNFKAILDKIMSESTDLKETAMRMAKDCDIIIVGIQQGEKRHFAILAINPTNKLDSMIFFNNIGKAENPFSQKNNNDMLSPNLLFNLIERYSELLQKNGEISIIELRENLEEALTRTNNYLDILGGNFIPNAHEKDKYTINQINMVTLYDLVNGESFTPREILNAIENMVNNHDIKNSKSADATVDNMLSPLVEKKEVKEVESLSPAFK